MGSTGESLTIGEVSRRTGLSIDTLRFYEREKLLPAPVGRGIGRLPQRRVDAAARGVAHPDAPVARLDARCAADRTARLRRAQRT